MAYDVMLVDDDFPMLKYLEQVLPWGEMGLRIAGSALSSHKALKLFKEKSPQIIITDIGLPQSDGIEMVAEMRRLNPDLRVIFLTCHEDFQYARRALQMNADDYLIKDELTPERLSESVRKSVMLLDETAKQREQLEKKVDIQGHRDVLKNSFISRIKAGDTSESVRLLGLRIGLDWNKPSFIVGLIHIDYSSFIRKYGLHDLKLICYALSNIMEDLSDTKEGFSIIGGKDGDYQVIYNFENNLSINSHEKMIGFLEKVRQAASDYLRIGIHYVISRPFKGLDAISNVIDKLRQYHLGQYYESQPSSVMRECKESEWHDSTYFVLRAKDEWINAFERRDAAGLRRILHGIADAAKQGKIAPSRWLNDCSQLIRMLEFESRYWRDFELFHSILLQTGKMNESLELAGWRIQSIMNSMNAETIAFSKTPQLQVIESYVRSHSSENITSVSMANYLHLNPSYFSRYFKKLTGMNYTDYVHRMKMGIAVQMMKNKEATIEIIAGRLGYSDRSYFSKVFKKYVGVSPSEYK